jgi:hypothetical protein
MSKPHMVFDLVIYPNTCNIWVSSYCLRYLRAVDRGADRKNSFDEAFLPVMLFPRPQCQEDDQEMTGSQAERESWYGCISSATWV